VSKKLQFEQGVWIKCCLKMDNVTELQWR